MRYRTSKRLAILGVLASAAVGSALAVSTTSGAEPVVDVSAYAPAPEQLQPFCETLPCLFVPTEDFASTSGRELLSSATPASECPDARAIYENAGHKLGGFFGPCPTTAQLQDIKPVDLAWYEKMARAHEQGD